MQPWRRQQRLGLCSQCRRPLALVPTIMNPRVYRIWNVFSILYIVALPIIGGAIVSMVIGDLPPRELVIVIAAMLLLWGSIDLWEGIAGVRTRIARSRNVVHDGAVARRISIPRIFAGVAALVLATAGFAI
ncbi:hypothetical protein [Novosphingobium sp. 9U]|uniref:hypothetical protein n=1 Tax=Novosphingobium sp. 9U TaxID=2653158 RepID=UPI001359A5BB|nr:hypothetical protein [Novosphingobium sp. 9U]